MQCPRCQAENSPATVFCSACGGQVEARCASCGGGNPLGSEVCAHCSRRLPPSVPSSVFEPTVFVDRDSELAALETAHGRAMQGYGQVLGVLGMPGIGKSRLCRRVLEHCRGEGAAVYSVRCRKNSRAVPFALLRDLLRVVCGLRECDDDEEVLKKLETAVAPLGDEGAAAVPIAADCLGLTGAASRTASVSREELRERLCAAMVELLVTRASTGPLVLLIEDTHWIDPASDAFLARLVDAIPGERCLVMLTFCPGYHAAWTGKAHYHQLPLHPLGPDASEEFLTGLLGEGSSWGDGLDILRERTRGHPFFMEEAVRWFAGIGILSGRRGAYQLSRSFETFDIPATVPFVLTERMETLSETVRQTVSSAALIAEPFSARHLQDVVDVPVEELAPALVCLQDAEFLREDPTAAVVRYEFVHPLVREAAAQLFPPERRTRVHTATARVLEEAYAQRPGDLAGRIAYHWQATGDRFKAETWLRRADLGHKPGRLRHGAKRTKRRA